MPWTHAVVLEKLKYAKDFNYFDHQQLTSWLGTNKSCTYISNNLGYQYPSHPFNSLSLILVIAGSAISANVAMEQPAAAQFIYMVWHYTGNYIYIL